MDLPAATLVQLERLAEAGIRIIPTPGLENYFVLEKDGCFALVEKRGDGFGQVGSPGVMTEQGFAPLLERDGKCSFFCRGYEEPANPARVAAIRAFFTQLKQALR